MESDERQSTCGGLQLSQLLDHVMRLAAVGALIVAILHHGHGCRHRSEDMVALVDRDGQLWCWRVESSGYLRREVFEGRQNAVGARIHANRET